ncbi:MAG TPA: adenosylcobinamide-GDP ribazoletransferase [Candidatus Binataceae bacterium]|nr:adenosylcobinamide-GDP ribazoletransferase [Candidatus Binataceae bacterium]
MSDDSPPDDPRAHPFARGLIQIRLAASFLTILPLGPAAPATLDDQAASFGWFPLIGFALGLALCLEARLLDFVFGPVLGSLLIVMTLVAVTGALHLDGLADTADALGARADRARALEILRDSHIGTFGTLALIFVIGLKTAALAGSHGAHRYAALYAAPGLARWAMTGISYGLEYLREQGAGTPLLKRGPGRNLRLATIIAVAGIIPLFGRCALRASLTAVVITLALRWFYRRWLGGITGDLIGAAGEIVETAVLIAVAH